MESVETTGGSNTMRESWIVVALLFVLSGNASGQTVRSLVNSGNDLYEEEKYTDAEVNYRKALEKEQGLVPGHYNLGNSLYKQGKFDESVKEYEHAALKAESKDARSGALFNIGNSFMKAEKYQEAVKSYVEALKQNPNDLDAKYNLSYALEKLRQQQQQQQQKQQNKDDKNKDKNQEQKEKNDQQNDQKDQQQQNQQQQQNEQQKQQQMAQQEKRMSKEDAERILEVLKNNERDVQKKLRVKKTARAKTEKDW